METEENESEEGGCEFHVSGNDPTESFNPGFSNLPGLMGTLTPKESTSEKLRLWTAAALATAGFLFAITPAHHLVGVPSTVAYLLLVPCIAIFIHLSRRIDHDERTQIAAVAAGRPALTAQEFGKAYFSGEAVHVAARCREIFAEFYRFDASRIHPDDRLCAELRFAAQDGLEADEFLMAIEKEFVVSFSAPETRLFHTMRDITEVIVRKLHKEP